ncbi:MAG: L-threonylcarbamoyladenylate synthase [Patescibacteria group bacterium]
MKQFSSVNDPEIARILTAGGIGVLRTDTLYGVVARADDEAAVRRVYELKGRDDNKSPIVLIGSLNQMYDDLSATHRLYLATAWPGPVSVIIPSVNSPTWIRRGNDSVAYRMPATDELCALVNATGPLIAPSANPQGMQPALNADEARYYFGSKVDFYVNSGTVDNPAASQLVRIDDDGKVTRLR